MQNENFREDLLFDRQMTREQEIALKNKRAGITAFQISWIMVFICLVVVNWQLRYTAPTWPPPDVPPLDRVLPTLATVGLLLSCLLARRSVQAIRADDQTGFLVQWRGVLLLGAAFVAIMVFEWLTAPAAANGIVTTTPVYTVEQFYNVFRLMVGFHGVHALAIGVYMLHVLRRARQGAYDPLDYWDAEAGAKLWYFVAVAWVLFYVVLYWI